MTDADQPAEESLIGIKGWLLLYAIVVGLQASSLLGKVMVQWRNDVYLGVGDRLTTIFFFIAYLVGLYFLLEVPKPITRKFHIGLNGFWAATLAVAGGSNGRSGPMGGLRGNVYLGSLLDWIQAGAGNLLPRRRIDCLVSD